MPVILLLCLFASVYGEEGKLISLDDSSFEHLTQAATGATTGDWLVLMSPYANKCTECENIENVLLIVNEKFKQQMSIATLIPEKSKITLRRFRIRKPVIMFFKRGYQWQYKGSISALSISEFIKHGHTNSPYKPVVTPIDWFDMWQEDFTAEIKTYWKTGKLPSSHTCLVAVALSSLAGVIFLCLCWPRKAHQKQN